jgi:hypothetical protein
MEKVKQHILPVNKRVVTEPLQKCVQTTRYTDVPEKLPPDMSNGAM